MLAADGGLVAADGLVMVLEAHAALVVEDAASAADAAAYGRQAAGPLAVVVGSAAEGAHRAALVGGDACRRLVLQPAEVGFY